MKTRGGSTSPKWPFLWPTCGPCRRSGPVTLPGAAQRPPVQASTRHDAPVLPEPPRTTPLRLHPTPRSSGFRGLLDVRRCPQVPIPNLISAVVAIPSFSQASRLTPLPLLVAPCRRKEPVRSLPPRLGLAVLALSRRRSSSPRGPGSSKFPSWSAFRSERRAKTGDSASGRRGPRRTGDDAHRVHASERDSYRPAKPHPPGRRERLTPRPLEA